MSRPQRQHKAPLRFGTFASEEEVAETEMFQEDSEEEEEREMPARRRAAQRHKRCWRGEEEEEAESEGERSARRKKPAKWNPAARATDGEGEEDDSSSESEGESSGDERVRTAPAQRRARKSAPFVPAPPAEPRSCSDMLSLLFACPDLIEALLAPDGLRSITLVARDAAHLAIALCAHSSEMAGLWQQLARRCDPALTGSVTDADALTAVRHAIRADRARFERINTTTAEGEYRVTRKELQGLSYETYRSHHTFWASTVKMFCKLDVLAIAHRKWGHLGVLEEQRAAARERSARAKEARQGKAAQREEEMAKALAAAGLAGPGARRRGHMARQIKAYLKRGEGNAAAIAEALRKEGEEARGRQKRHTALLKRLKEEGLKHEVWRSAARAFIAGRPGGQTLEQAVAAIRQANAESEALVARRTSITRLFIEEGLQAYLPEEYSRYHSWDGIFNNGMADYWNSPVPGLTSYVNRGDGSEEAVLAAARALHASERAKEQRRGAARAALEAEGLQTYDSFYLLPSLRGFVERDEGGVEQLVAAARQLRQQAEEQQARRERIEELLTAEGLPRHAPLQEVNAFVHGEGSEADALAAARAAAHKAAQQLAARQQRQAALVAALAAEGIEFYEISEEMNEDELCTVNAFIFNARDSQEHALAAVRAAHQAKQAREERRAKLAALLQAEGLSLDDCECITGMRTFLWSGAGSAETLVARAVAARQAANPPPGLRAYVV